MADLSKAINDAVEEMGNDGTIQKIINEAATGMIKDAVKSAFNYNSPLKKKVEAAIQESIQIDLDQVDFSKHNTAMIHSISESFKNEMLVGQVTKMKEKIASFFSAPEKASYTVTEFTNELCKKIKDGCTNDYEEDTTVHVSVEKGTCGYEYKLNIGDRYSSRGDRECIHIVIRENEKRRDDAGKIFIVHSPSIELGHGGGIEGWIYGLYSHGVTIVDCESFDIDNCDLTVWNDEDEYY
ncbi:MAG: hypothetical protein Unbinned1520contig1002_24 [Prokaryotic dsDNA virus sp.]|nr:MAG: hypothetical protein Unbinned1520contig1002_24 [Prokaryotic dsDNA virus sp.]